MTFEKHLRSGSRAAAQRLGIMKHSWQVFHDRSLLLKFVLPVLEYCSSALECECSSALVCASSLLNFLVPQDLCTPLSISMERSQWPCSMVWDWWVARAVIRLFVGIICSLCLSLFSPFLPSLCWLCGFGFRIGSFSLSTSHALLTFLIIL